MTKKKTRPAPFFRRLARFRERHGLTLRKAGELFGVSHLTVWRWESRKTDPNRFVREYVEGVMAKFDGGGK